MHAAERLLREIERFKEPLRAERRANDLRVRDVYQVVFAKRNFLYLDARRLEDVGHDGKTELVVSCRPVVELRVSLAVRDLDAFGVRRKRE